jgi:hypothetical protein
MSAYHHFSQLPPKIRQQVADFIEFLLQKYQPVQAKADVKNTEAYPLRGSVLRYEDPFGPATEGDDWEVYS